MRCTKCAVHVCDRPVMCGYRAVLVLVGIIICVALMLTMRRKSPTRWYPEASGASNLVFSPGSSDSIKSGSWDRLDKLTNWRPLDVDGLQDMELELTYHRLINYVHVRCLSRVRIGNYGDGGWDVCLQGRYRPTRNNCLVYSFGINDDWSFDVKFVSRFGCTVRSFDPSIRNHTVEIQRGPGSYFYPWGLAGEDRDAIFPWVDPDRRKTLFPVRTLSSIRHHCDDQLKVIDYLKIDIEGFEWEALDNMINDGVLSEYVKQIGLEYHSLRKIVPSVTTYRRFIETMERLEGIGFRKWLVNWNMHCPHIIGNMYRMTDCYEVYYVNNKFS